MSKAENIILIGPMGAGKTTIGRQLAQLLHKTFIDVDHEIEARTGVSIPTIFDIEGEDGFRSREASVLDDLSREPGLVLATGGGAVLEAENRAHLSGRGFVVYLHATIEQQLRRTGHSSHRPLLAGGDPREILERLFKVRDPLYREVADLVIDTNGRNARLLADEIEQHLDRPAAVTE